MAAVICFVLLRAGVKAGVRKAYGSGLGRTTTGKPSATQSAAPSPAQSAAQSSFGVSFAAPEQLNRSEFAQPDAPWLLAVFTAKNCGSCAEVWQQLQPLASETVAVVEISRQKLLNRYGIEAVPTVVLADSTGRVRHSHLGRLATDTLAQITNLTQG